MNQKNCLSLSIIMGAILCWGCGLQEAKQEQGSSAISNTADPNVCSPAQGQIRFLGTGTPNHEVWATYHRQLSSALVNTDLLIDFSCWSETSNVGTCGVARLNQYNIDKNSISALLITHHHLDHFDKAEIVRLAQARTAATKLTLYSGRETVEAMNAYLAETKLQNLLNVQQLTVGQRTSIGQYGVTPIKANHDSNTTETFVYVIEFGSFRFLYGLDSGCFPQGSTSQAQIYAQKLDLVIREGTHAFANTDCTAGHMNFAANQNERKDWIAKGVISETTPFWLSHLVPYPPGGCNGRCNPGAGLTPAIDGDVIPINKTTCPKDNPPNPPVPNKTVPLHRYWNKTIGDHLYTTNWNELGAGRSDWSYEGIQAYVYPNQVEGTIPLHRYWNKTIGDHFYTTNWDEFGAGRPGWSYEGIQCYVYPGQVAGTVPLHRYWNKTIGDHFYTTNWDELGAGRSGWSYEGIQCYVGTK